jgi:uncharacterized protein
VSVTLIKNLQNPLLFDHEVHGFRVIETHSAWVLLTGVMAYKIKKPVDFKFLDFSTLEKRRHYCQLEFEINQKLAPRIYKRVIKITGTEDKPVLGDGDRAEPIEYAIQMREFPQENLLSFMIAQDKLSIRTIDAMAYRLAHIHQQAARTRPEMEYGTPQQVHKPVKQNFDQIRPLLEDSLDLQNLAVLEAWSDEQFQRLKNVFQARKDLGYVRACHGDVHLGNIVLLNYQPILFDAIEFNEEFRWTDIMADVGFLVMDLKDKKYPQYAHRFVSAYLEHIGDYHGLQVLPYYTVYRALVRAKVSLLRALQPGLSDVEQKELRDMYRNYIDLALAETHLRDCSLILMHGFSGSGKSTLARWIVEKIGAVQLRSDVERKRLSGVGRMMPSRASVNQGIYKENVTQRIYQRLLDLSAQVIGAGFPVIVDATFLKAEKRKIFADLAKQLGVCFLIVDCHADDATLEAWIKRRLLKRKDPSEATLEVLAMQRKTADPLSPDELEHTIILQAVELENPEGIFSKLKSFLHKPL